jgi:hypothetical protein
MLDDKYKSRNIPISSPLSITHSYRRCCPKSILLLIQIYTVSRFPVPKTNVPQKQRTPKIKKPPKTYKNPNRQERKNITKGVQAMQKSVKQELLQLIWNSHKSKHFAALLHVPFLIIFQCISPESGGVKHQSKFHKIT